MQSSYTSPLMEQLRDGDTLSLQILATEVPLVKNGKLAAKELEEKGDSLPRDKQRALARAIAQGERSAERLVVIALPLIHSLANKEYARRQNWRSRIPLDDIVAEGISGFLRGINAYNPEGNHKSPTNYLGQWITMEIRRNLEVMEHDFHIPYESMERYRKIRAVRSRIAHELGREPTDEETLKAANNGGQFGDTFLGKVIKTPSEKGKIRRTITQKHLDDERTMYERTGAFYSTTISTEDGEYSTADTMDAHSVTLDQEQTGGNIEHHESTRAHAAMNALIENALALMHLGDIQKDIIRRRYGIKPYDEAQNIKDIAAETSLLKHKVTRILNLFSKEMSAPSGAFHYLVAQMHEEDAYSYGLEKLKETFGTFPPGAKITLPHHHLRENLITGTEDLQGNQPSDIMHAKATYYCPFGGPHVERFYEPGETPRPTITCPHCQRPIPRQR